MKTRIRLKTENILNNLIKDINSLTVNFANAINTTVCKDGKVIIDIYYRRHEIRINIKNDSILMDVYKEMLSQRIAYQKYTASAHSSPNIFAFFVNDDDIETALCYLIRVIT